jgi:hypothetical protein
LEWSKDINTDLWYAWKISRWYRQFSGIEILVYEDGEYVSKGRFFDTGPIAWRLTAAQVPLKDHGDSVKIRLSFLPDNWSIDWLGFDCDEYQSPPVNSAACVDTRANRDVIADGALNAVRKDDDDYLVTYPGEWIDLIFAVPSRQDPESVDRTFFVRSKGYYVEWVRPEWVRERPDVPGFDLSHRDDIAQQLQQLWLSKKNRIELDFFGSKIPSWNAGGRP